MNDTPGRRRSRKGGDPPEPGTTGGPRGGGRRSGSTGRGRGASPSPAARQAAAARAVASRRLPDGRSLDRVSGGMEAGPTPPGLAALGRVGTRSSGRRPGAVRSSDQAWGAQPGAGAGTGAGDWAGPAGGGRGSDGSGGSPRWPRPVQAGGTRRSPRDHGGGGRDRRRGPAVVAALVVVVVVLAAALAAVQLTRAVPGAHLATTLPASVVVPGTPPSLPWPTVGQAEVQVAGIGSFGPVGGSAPIPIGSVAKIMAAYVILHDHPLTDVSGGPGLTITAADVATYQADQAQQDSVAAVSAGEVLTEGQALQALLVPSGDNIATLLANWDAGSEAAFVAKMNAAAAALGMAHTHYADVSGLSAQTVSTAADQLALAPVAMALPVFAQIVAMPQVTLPVAGTVYNYDSLLGTDGIIGIKTGSTPEAGGCLVFAATSTVAGRPQTIYGAVLGQPATQAGQGIIAVALAVSRQLLAAARAAVRPVTVLPAGTVAARVHAPWGSGATAATSRAVTLLGWPGLRARATTTSVPLARSTPAGATVGRAQVRLGSQLASVPLRTSGSSSGPSLGWRLLHG